MANWIKLMKDQHTDYAHNLHYLKKYREEGDTEALEWLVLNNANLVHKIVGGYRTFYHHKLDYDDLFSVGLEGLLRAAEKFDFSYDNNFATYATYWIRQSVVRLISGSGFSVKIPSHIFETLQQVTKKEIELTNEEDTSEVLSQVGITQEKYDLIEDVKAHMLRWTSLNKPISANDETELGSLVDQNKKNLHLNQAPEVSPEDRLSHVELQESIKDALEYLDEREQMIVKYRFGLFGYEEKTLAQIGEMEGISRERIRQLEARAIRKLSKKMKDFKDYV